MKEILKIKNISKDYGIKGFKTNVLKNISLTVNEGDFISIMGPSGAGKTTLLNLMSTLDKQTSGEIILDYLVDIYNSFLDNVNGNIKRDELYYKNLFEEVKSEGGHVYIHQDREIDGYIIYFLNDDNMFVRELFYKNIDSFRKYII